MYAAYLEWIFSPSTCVCVVHKGDDLNPLTHQEKIENSGGMNAVREPIEHSYAVV